MERCCTPWYLKISFLVLLFGFTIPSGFAQILHLSPAEVKAQTRKNQKEAALYQADHKESHLEVQNFDPRKGRSGRQQAPVPQEPAEYVSDIDKNAIYEVPREPAKKEKTGKSKKKSK
jgi:hypothetical protein